MDDEPHFGEVWKWEDMGPYMIVSPSLVLGQVNVMALTGPYDQGRLVSLVWDEPGRTFREKWQRIDTEELG